MSQPEIDQLRSDSREFLTRIGYVAPQSHADVQGYLGAIQAERQRVAGLTNLPDAERQITEYQLQAAEFEVDWQDGEIDATHGYFTGIGADIGNRLQDPTYKKETRAPKTNVKTTIWEIGGETFDSETLARPAMAAAVLAERDRRMVDLARGIDEKKARGEDLTPQELGHYHAARIIDDYAHSVGVGVEMGATGQIKQAIDQLWARRNDLSGLDGNDTQVVLEKQAASLPHPWQLAALASDNDIARGIDGRPTTFLGAKIAEIINRTTQDINGRPVSATELTVGGGLDLEKAARERMDICIWRCVQGRVRAYELSEGGRVGGVSALRAEMRKRKLEENLLWQPYRDRGQENHLQALMDLDGVYRGRYEGQSGEFIPGVFSAGQFWSGVDPDRAKVIISDLLRPEDFRGVTSLRDWSDLLATIETRGGIQERIRAERARRIFGIDRAGVDEDKLQDVAGYQDFLTWSMTRQGKYKDERTGQPISWVQGDPIVPERIRESSLTWFKDYVMGSVDPHLSATKKSGVDPNQIIQVVLWAELARREGVDLGDFMSQVAATDGSEAERIRIAGDICQAAGMRDTLVDALVGTVDATGITPGALVELAPLLTPEGRLNYVAAMERLKVRAWGEKTQWQQLADVEADLFKHLAGATKGEVMELFYQVGYENQFRNYRDSVLTSGKNIPEEIDALVSGQKFLRYRTGAEMGLDFNSSLSQSIGSFLEREVKNGHHPAWAAFAGDNIGKYVRTAERRGAGGVTLEGLPADAREQILINLGIDINQALPEQGYKSWRNNLDNLIKNGKKLGYSNVVMEALRDFNGHFDMDPRKSVLPRDVVLEFKWRLARAAYDKYLGLGQTQLRKGDMTFDEVWLGLNIEKDGLLSLSEFAEQFEGLWGGDILAKELEGKLNPSFAEKTKNLIREPGAEGGAMLERTMIKVFDFLHGQKIPRLKTLIPDFLEAPLNVIIPADVPTAIALITNVAIGWSLSQIFASGSLLEMQAAFHAFPILDKIPLVSQVLNLIPSWARTVSLSPQLSGAWIGGVLWNMLMPFPLSGLKVQAYLFNWSLEGLNSILIRNRWGRLLSEKELKKSRAPKGENK